MSCWSVRVLAKQVSWRMNCPVERIVLSKRNVLARELSCWSEMSCQKNCPVKAECPGERIVLSKRNVLSNELSCRGLTNRGRSEGHSLARIRVWSTSWSLDGGVDGSDWLFLRDVWGVEVRWRTNYEKLLTKNNFVGPGNHQHPPVWQCVPDKEFGKILVFYQATS